MSANTGGNFKTLLLKMLVPLFDPPQGSLRQNTCMDVPTG